jgi:MFS family permease
MPPGRPVPRRIGFLSAEAWTPMRYPIFAGLWIATLLNYIGTAARDNMGSPWLMKDLAEGRHDQPVLVGLVTVAATLPLALFSVFAGTLADLFDRRRLLIVTQLWMVAISVLLGFCTWVGFISPWGLLGLTVLLALGTAASNPAFQAVLPELVPPKDISLAMGLNSVALNLARAAGPAMFMVAMALWKGRRGIAASYMLIALTFVGVTAVLYVWKRPHQRAAVHGERFWGALQSGLQYTIHSRANLAILLRVLTFIVPSLALWSQLPILAKQVHVGATGFSVLMVCLGGGAIFGVFMMQDLQRRFSIDGAVNGCTAMFALGLVLLSQITHAWLADLVMFFLGINWVIVPTNFNVATQTSVPPWVKGRALSMYLTVLWGSFAIGGAIWGHVTEASGLPMALMTAGIIMAALLVLSKWFPLTLNAGHDLSPALKGGKALPDDLPMLSNPPGAARGAVQISIAYKFDAAARPKFVELAHEVGKQRRRNGASSWRLEEAEQADSPAVARYVEQFSFATAAECARQPARLTVEDMELLAQLRRLHSGPEAPAIVCESNDRPQAGAWWEEQLYHCIERSLDEMEAVYRRLVSKDTIQ